MSNKVFVLGSFVVDAAYRTRRLPVWGETLLGTGFSLGPGGKGSNQAVAAARAGAEVTFLTRVGGDPFGHMGRALWAEEGIDSAAVRESEEPTGSAAILLDPETGQNAIIVVPGACAALTASDVDAAAEQIRGADVFLAQLEVPLPAVRRGLEIAGAAGVRTILNPAPAQLLEAGMLGLVDFLIPNETEAAEMTGGTVRDRGEAAAAAQKLLDRGARNVILTLGERGSLLLSEGQDPVLTPAFRPARVLDTTGAGDAFCGAFATALAQGSSPVDAARFASAAAGLSVTRHGTARAMPQRSEIDALLAGHA